MADLIKKFLILIVFIFSISVVYSNEITHTIYTPFGTVIDEQVGTYDSGISREPTRTAITTRFSDFGLSYEPDNLNAPKEPFCRIGGWYTAVVTNDPGIATTRDRKGPKPEVIEETYNLFYCKTQYDLLSMMKIPSGWENAKLDLYCNDGSSINMPTINKDILTLKLATFRACILKNRDLDEHNTIIYGFESGNKVIDSDEKYYYNNVDLSNPVVRIIKAQFESVTETTLVNSPPGISYNFDGKTFYFNHDGGTHNLYTLKDTAQELTVPITNVFDMAEVPEFELSRVALFRTLGDGKKIYGFETAQSLIVPESERIDPVYRIKTSGFGIPTSTCTSALGSYGAIEGDNLFAPSYVVCRTNGEIMINGRTIDVENGDYVSLNLFKNIILSINTGIGDEITTDDSTGSYSGEIDYSQFTDLDNIYIDIDLWDYGGIWV